MKVMETMKKLVEVYLGTTGSWLRSKKSEYDRFSPAAHGWGIKHFVSDKVPPLLTEEEGPST
jgi:hypothetical protein